MRARFVLYGVALGLMGLVLVAQPFAGREPPFWTLHGTTDQHDDIRIRLDARGRVRTFELNADLYCTGGRISNAGWHPSEGGAPARFGSRGPRFDAVEVWGVSPGPVERSELRGSVARDGASGTLEMTRSRGGREQCSSGVVAWTAD